MAHWRARRMGRVEGRGGVVGGVEREGGERGMAPAKFWDWKASFQCCGGYSVRRA